MRRALGPALVAAMTCAAAALPTAPASAAASAYVFVVRDQYIPGDVKVIQGETLTLVNLDTIAHDLVSSDWNAEIGDWEFAATAADPGKSSVVKRVESLGLGYYPYLCMLHEYMRGTVEIIEKPQT